MKKKIIIGFLVLTILVISIISMLFINKNVKTFYLDDDYYGSSEIIEIGKDELYDLINKKESFAVFVYQPMCVTSADFESVLYSFLENKKISIYKISFSSIKNTEIGDIIKYYPSFIIYNEGKMVDFLEADKDEDVEFYTSEKGFEKWFTKYVNLGDVSLYGDDLSNNQPNRNENNNFKDVNVDLESVIKEKDKVNIYFFWGDGCPHCEEEFEFLNSIEEQYGKYYNLYAFETWYNEENVKLIYTFAGAMGDEVKGVPYTIIGNKSFRGFSEKSKNDFIRAIETEHTDDFDVYIDRIKKSS